MRRADGKLELAVSLWVSGGSENNTTLALCFLLLLFRVRLRAAGLSQVQSTACHAVHSFVVFGGPCWWRSLGQVTAACWSAGCVPWLERIQICSLWQRPTTPHNLWITNRSQHRPRKHASETQNTCVKTKSFKHLLFLFAEVHFGWSCRVC